MDEERHIDAKDDTFAEEDQSLHSVEVVEEEDDFDETMDDEWLVEAEEDTEFGDDWLSSIAASKSKAAPQSGVVSKEWKFGPQVKISAVTGVGLQELLELVDEKLKQQDERLKKEKGLGREGSFDRKWRPPRPDDGAAAIAVEQ